MKLARGDKVRVRRDAPLCPGHIVNVLEVLSDDRVRVAHAGIGHKGITVPVSLLDLPTVESEPASPIEAALRRLSVGKASGDRLLALTALNAAGAAGLTDFELAGRTGRKQTSIGVRRGELRDVELVEDTGTKRPSDTGAPATVWRITGLGRDALGDIAARKDGAA